MPARARLVAALPGDHLAGRSATATLIYGVRFAKRELMKPDDDEQWSHEVLETFGDIDEFYSTTVEEGLAERFDLKLFAFDEDEERMYALYSGDRTDAEWGAQK